LWAALGRVDVVPCDPWQDGFEHHATMPETTEIDVLDLTRIAYEEGVVLLRNEVDVGDRKCETFLNNDEGPGSLIQLAKTGVDSGGETAIRDILGVFVRQFAGRTEDEYRTRSGTERDDLVKYRPSLSTAGDTRERHHILDVEVLRLSFAQLECSDFKAGLEALLFTCASCGAFFALLDEYFMLFFGEVGSTNRGFHICRESELNGPFGCGGGDCSGCGLGGLFSGDDVIAFEFEDGFAVVRIVVEEDFMVPLCFGNAIVAIVIFEEFQGDAVEDVVGMTLDYFLVLAFLVVVGDVDTDVGECVEDGTPPALGLSQRVEVVSGQVEDAAVTNSLKHREDINADAEVRELVAGAVPPLFGESAS